MLRRLHGCKMYARSGDTGGHQVRLYDKNFYLRQPGRSDEFVRELEDAVERRSRETTVSSSSSSSSSPRDYQLGRGSQLVQRAFQPLTIDFTTPSAPAAGQTLSAVGHVSFSIDKKRAVFRPNLVYSLSLRC